MKLKKLLTLSSAMTMALTMAACSSSSDSSSSSSSDSEESTSSETSSDTSSDSSEEESKTVTLTVSSPAEDQTSDEDSSRGWLQEMCEAFAEEHPNWDITFDYRVVGEGSAGDEVSKDPSAAPDVYMFASDQTGTLIECNGISRFGGTALETIENETDPTLVATVTDNDGVYGVPFTSNTWFMYYNNEIFSEEDVKSLDTMLEKGMVTFPLDNFWYSASFFYGEGCTLFGEDGNTVEDGIQFDNENGLAAVEYMVGLASNPNFTNDQDTTVGIDMLRKGTAGCIFSGSWNYEGLKDMGDKLSMAGTPTFGEDNKPMRAYLTSKAIGVNPNASDLEVANALALYLGSEKAQLAHWEERGIVPCNLTLLEDEDIKSNQMVVAQNATVANAVPQPTISAMSDIFTAGEAFGKEIVSKSITMDNAAEKLAAFQKQMESYVK